MLEVVAFAYAFGGNFADNDVAPVDDAGEDDKVLRVFVCAGEKGIGAGAQHDHDAVQHYVAADQPHCMV